jgi:uncharacterized repeat protein (TIGR02543 family)
VTETEPIKDENGNVVGEKETVTDPETGKTTTTETTDNGDGTVTEKVTEKDADGNVTSETENTKPKGTFTVTFDSNGGSAVAVQNVAENGVASKPANPSRSGYTFKEWQLDGKAYDFATPVTANITLKAEWTKKSSSGGSGGTSTPTTYAISVSASENGSISPVSANVERGKSQTFTINANIGYEVADVLVDGKSVGAVSSYTFDNVNTTHSISATFKEKDGSSTYTDVPVNSWYTNAVDYVTAKGLMNGVSEGAFDPLGTLSRGMLATILWRLEGSPATTSESIFPDVASGRWYSDAIVWATAEGIVKGYSNGNFGPNDPVTREQFAAIMYRYAATKSYDVSKSASLSEYVDQKTVSNWALDSMRWANATGLIVGTPASTLVPTRNANRAQAATILMRFCENVAK